MRWKLDRFFTAALPAAAVLAACTGQISDSPAGGGPGGRGSGGSGAGGGDDQTQPLSCDLPVADTTPLRRMTASQYRNTVRTLFGAAIDPGTTFPRAAVEEGFSTYADANVVTAVGAEGIFDAAEHVAAQVTPSTVLPCSPSSPDAACVDAFVTDLGRRAFRRPLEQSEHAILVDLYGAVSDATTAERVEMVIKAVLQMPQFLYITQGGGELVPGNDAAVDGDPVMLQRLTSWEVASRLSYLIWDDMPDDALFALAESDALSEPAAIADQARRMLDDPRAEATLLRFHREWLQIGSVNDGLSKDPSTYPAFDQTLADSMVEETDRFVRNTLIRDDGTFANLLAGTRTEVDAPLAALYGIDSGSTGAGDWREVDMAAGRRGLLTMGAFLSAHAHLADTSPVFRGVWVQRNVLCREVPPPPANAPTEAPDTGATGSTWRDRLAAHRAEPTCAACHDAIDPPGLSFETFDGIGRQRTTDRGDSIDPAGTFEPWGDLEGSFADASEMVGLLAESRTAHDCYATRWFEYAHGRKTRRIADGCSLDALQSAFDDAGGNVRELIVALTQTDAFLYRVAPEEEQQ